MLCWLRRQRSRKASERPRPELATRTMRSLGKPHRPATEKPSTKRL